MLLAIDARNSSINIGIRSGTDWLTVLRLSPDRTADEYALLMQSAVARSPGIQINRALIASVVPGLTARLARAVLLAFGREAKLVGPGIRTGLHIRTDVPSELGADIVCSAVAARQLCAEACIVVDFATAISCTALTAKGDLLGVAIAPGMETAARALRTSTAQLSDVLLEAPPGYIGKNTARALQSGLFLGFTGLVRELVGGILSEMTGPVQLLGTGDEYGRLILDRLAGQTPGQIGVLPALTVQHWPPSRFVPDLALEGLALIAGMNP